MKMRKQRSKKSTARKAAKKSARRTPAKRKVAKQSARRNAKSPRATRRPAPAQPLAKSSHEAIQATGEAATPLTVKEALEIALDFELKVRDHYAKGAATIKDPQGSKVFAVLAKEEQGHVDYIRSRFDELAATGTVVAQPLKSNLPSLSWVREAETKHRATASLRRMAEQHELDLLKTALRLEMDASGFYHDLVRRLPESDRPVLEQFLAIEDGHLAIVQAELDSVQGLGYWFDVPEFALEAQ
jgi:rubrerythrin